MYGRLSQPDQALVNPTNFSERFSISALKEADEG